MRHGRLFTTCVVGLLLDGCGPTSRVDLDTLRTMEHQLADGAVVAGRSLFGAGHTLVLTLDPECPLCLMHAPELAQLTSGTGLSIVGLYASPYIVPDSAQAFAERNGFRFPQVMDPDCRIAQALDAVVTPEAFVLAVDGTVLYRGAIDDRATRAGRKKPKATRHHLRDALAAVERGHPPAEPSVRAVGCFLECNEVRTP
ncbi:MAG: redoxin domain-containing protein [Flavobacteriales bacterium]|nr:redoxin domain-containing protein [Flavobacteriales bacterium]MBK9701727.1 redoxin domain-containing protein [Flavobacteriales bacterium]